MFNKIKQSVDITTHIGKYVELRPGNPAKGKCPFHGNGQEHTPSFAVYADHWFCYACNIGGSVIDFELHRQNLGVLDAARSLCSQYNITVSQEEGERYEKTERRRKEKVDMLLALPRIGTDREDLFKWLREQRGFSDKTIQDLGISVALRENSVVVPIRDKYGRVVAFARRVVDYEARGCPKWLNDAQDDIYDKKSILYNLDQARRNLREEQKLILVESYFDVAALWEAGIKTGVAYCSARLTREQCEEIKAMSSAGTTVLFGACNDATAQDKLLANRVELHTIAPDVHIRALVIPQDCKDLNDVLLKHGREALAKLICTTVSMDRYLLDQVIANEPIVDLQYRKARQIVAMAENPLSQKDLVQHLSKVWNKDEQTITQYMTGKTDGDAASVQFDNIGTLMAKYEEYVRNIGAQRIWFGWREYDRLSRGMKPGDVIQLIAAAGTGKTMWAEQLMLSIGTTQPDVPMIFYSLEQSGIMAFERFMQMEAEMDGQEVERWMAAGEDAHNTRIYNGAQSLSKKLKNLLVCDQGNLNMRQIEEYTARAGFAYFGRPVGVIFIDYLGYIHGDGKSMYEVVSLVARGQKEMAKRLGCRVVSLHQTTKGGKQGAPIDDSHARDSSAVRDSADLLISAWRPELEDGLVDERKKQLAGIWRSKLLKNRYGASNMIVDFEFDAKHMKLKQRNHQEHEAAVESAITSSVLAPAPDLASRDGKELACGG